MTEDDARPELPGSTTPPVEGVRWVWVKLGAWGLAIGLILLAAFVAAVVIGGVSRRAGDGADRVVAALNETFESSRQEDLLEVREAPVETPTGLDETSVPEFDLDEPVTWRVRPRPEYPEEALRANIEAATVVLVCRAATSGRAEDCRAVSETPTGHGFGRAALAAMDDVRLEPAERDGIPVERPFRFTIRFQLN